MCVCHCFYVLANGMIPFVACDLQIIQHICIKYVGLSLI